MAVTKANCRFIKPRQPVDHFIARKPFYQPQWPVYQRQLRFINRRQPVDHFITRRPFYRPPMANGRFIKPRQLIAINCRFIGSP